MSKPTDLTDRHVGPVNSPMLCPDDARLLDHMIEAIHQGPNLHLTDTHTPHTTNPHTDSAATAIRTDKLACILSLLDKCPDEPAPSDLVQRTIAKAREAKQKQRFSQQIQALSGRAPGMRWADVLTTAAMIMIGISLLWPLMEKSREQARRAACASNLATAGAAIGQYASDHGNTLPRSAAKPGTVWWNVGQKQADADDPVQSNSAHLYLLIRNHYISSSKLACPDNHNATTHMTSAHHAHDWDCAPAVSYSYQNQYTREKQTLDRLNDMAILADKNPLFIEAANGAPGLRYRDDASTNLASSFHGQQGQNVLTSTGRVKWTKNPVMPGGDNIWTIRGIDRYEGMEAPEDMNDSFLVP